MTTDWLRHRDELLDQVRRGSIDRDQLDGVLAELVGPTRQGSTAHAEFLIELLDASPVLRSAIRNLLFDEADAEDALQETLLAVCRSLDGFRAESSVSAWAAGIARNKAKDILRRKGRPAIPEPIVDVPTEVERFTSQWATHADVDRALAALSDKLRPVFVLADIEGLTYDQIAAQLGIERNTVASRLRRARAQLGIDLAVHTG